MDGGNGIPQTDARAVAVPAILYVSEAELAKQLSYRNTADPRLTQVCADATNKIDAKCGKTTQFVDPIPAAIANVALSLAVDIWKQPDATFGIIGLGETGMVRTPRDLIARYEDALIPYYEPSSDVSAGGWGVA
jgi:hypothetical protein